MLQPIAPERCRIPIAHFFRKPIPSPRNASSKPTKTRWLVLLLISLMYMITYMDRTGISIAAPAMARDFGLSRTTMGIVFSVFLWAYAIGQIPGGSLADRFGPRLILLIIVPFWSRHDGAHCCCRWCGLADRHSWSSSDWQNPRPFPPRREPCSSGFPRRNAASSTESRIVSAGLRLQSYPSLQSVLWSRLGGAGFSTFSERQACYGR